MPGTSVSDTVKRVSAEIVKDDDVDPLDAIEECNDGNNTAAHPDITNCCNE